MRRVFGVLLKLILIGCLFCSSLSFWPINTSGSQDGLISFITPAANEKITGGTGYLIQWSCQEPPPPGATQLSIDLYYHQLNNPLIFIAKLGILETSYLWQVPNEGGSNFELLVRAVANNYPYASVTQQFQILAPTPPPSSITVRVKQPNGGEQWKAGEQREITWDISGDTSFAKSIILEASSNGGSAFYQIGTALDLSERSYLWQVPPVNSSACRIQVSLVNSFGSTLASDMSDRDFSIQGYDLPKIQALAIFMRAKGASVAQGDPISVRILVVNTSGETVQNVSVDGSIPAQLRYISSDSGGAARSFDGEGQPFVRWNIPSLGPSDYRVMNVTYQASPPILMKGNGEEQYASLTSNALRQSEITLIASVDLSQPPIKVEASATAQDVKPVSAGIFIETNGIKHFPFINGYTGDLGQVFLQDRLLTREQLAKIICSILQCPQSQSKYFTDVGSERWSYGWIAAVKERNLMIGYPDGSFKPEAFPTASEIAVVAYRIAQRSSPDSPDPPPLISCPTNSLTQEQRNSWAKAYWNYSAVMAIFDVLELENPESPVPRNNVVKAFCQADLRGPLKGNSLKQHFQDMPPSNPFFLWIEAASSRYIGLYRETQQGAEELREYLE